MSRPMQAAMPGETLRDVLARIGPQEAAPFLADSPGFSIQVVGQKAPLERVEGTAGIYRFAGAGIVAKVEIELASDLAVAVQRVTLTNESSENSPPLRELFAFSLPLAVAAGDCPRACGFGGGLTDGFYPPRAYRPEEVTFGEARDWAPVGAGFARWWTGKGLYQLESLENGRSSNPFLPIMFAGWRTPEGEVSLWAALEWSARWRMEFGHTMEWRFLFRGGPRVKDLVLAPGESLKLPPVHIGLCRGGPDAVTNNIRRYVAEALAPDVEGRRPWPYVAYDHWFGLHEQISEELLLRQADRAAELGVEYFVVDAGWYPASGEKFWTGVGNWDHADAAKFPRGLEPLAEHVRSKGMRFGLWFEPERAYKGSHMLQAHPDWFQDIGTQSPHIRLDRREVQDGLVEVISRWVSRLDIRWLRWDNNQAPGPFWDAADPTGKVQFAYTEGLYRVFDALLQRHPNLMLDNCAGGGQRVDFGTLRRAGTMVISDHAEDHHVCRIMQLGGARLLPANYMNSSLGVGDKDAVRSARPLGLISRMAGAITLNGHIANWTRAQSRLAKKYIDGFKCYRHLLMKDFFALGEYPRSEGDWDVGEFADPATGEAVVLAYRVRGQVNGRRVFPRGLRPELSYRIVDPFSGKSAPERSGAELMEKGLRLRLAPESGRAWRLVP